MTPTTTIKVGEPFHYNGPAGVQCTQATYRNPWGGYRTPDCGIVNIVWRCDCRGAFTTWACGGVGPLHDDARFRRAHVHHIPA